MAKVLGLQKLQDQLKARARKALVDSAESVVVGFETAYALYVHENMEAKHPVGQAKFLEQPARALAKELGEVVKRTVASGQSLGKGLMVAGLRLQREAQQLCPVDTGALKNSAFTRTE